VLTDTQRICRVCGLVLPGAPGRPCPQCLLRLALTPFGDDAEDPDAAPMPSPSRFFGGYEILGEIARGGMGVVLRARDTRLRRDVALKLVHAAHLASPEARLRFQVEAEAAARLAHPNIVTLYESGEHEGMPFLSLQLVAGGTLAARVAGGPVPDREAVRLLSTVCRAVQHAHERGVLHRDLKPSNVLLDHAGEPLVTDFGLARIRGALEGITLPCSVLGSPSYMAPELVQHGPGAATTASDVYSLGAVLFELLAGTPPFNAPTPIETLRRVTDEEPRPLPEGVDPDLATITAKCLGKDPARRYPSAHALAADLERWLAGEPVLARPLPVWELAWRWCRRRPGLAAALAATTALLAVGAVGIAVATWRIRAANARTQIALRETQALNSRMRFDRAEMYFAEGDSPKAIATLAALVRAEPSNSAAANRLTSALTLRSFATRSLFTVVSPGVPIAFKTAGSNQLSLISDAGILSTRSLGTNIGERRVALPVGRPTTVAFSADGRWCAAAAASSVVVAETLTGNVAPVIAWNRPITHLALNPTGTRIAVGDADGTVEMRSTADIAMPGPRRTMPARLISLAWLGESDALGCITEDHLVRRWTSASNEPMSSWPIGRVRDCVWSADAVFVMEQSQAQLLRLAPGEEPLDLPHHGPVQHAVFSGDGRFLATASTDHSARLWDVGTGRLLGEAKHRNSVLHVAFNADGSQLATSSADATARVWAVDDMDPLTEPMRHPNGVPFVAFTGDGRLLSMDWSHTWTPWTLPRPNATLSRIEIGAGALSAAPHPNGNQIAFGLMDGRVIVWEVSRGRITREWATHRDWIYSIAWSPDGRWIATASRDSTAFLRDLENDGGHRLPHKTWVRSIRFDPEGRRAVTAAHDRSAVVWEVSTGRSLLRLDHGGEVQDALFSLDGRHVITASARGSVAAHVWDASTGRQEHVLGHHSGVETVALSTDGRRIVTASMDTTARVFDLGSGREQLRLTHPGNVHHAVFSEDGSLILTASADHRARLWDGRTGVLRHTLEHRDEVFRGTFSGDGRRMATASRDGTARVWDVASGLPITEPLTLGSWVTGVRFVENGRRLLSQSAGVSAEGTLPAEACLWPVPDVSAPVPVTLADLAEQTVALRSRAHGQFEHRAAAPANRHP
jgi:eukaryotic-like serine/threonine-protein kinase